MASLPATASEPRSAWRFAVLTTVVVLLVLALLAAAVWLSIEGERRDTHDRLVQVTDQAALTIKARLGETLQTLQLLATDRQVLDDESSFHATATQLFASNGALFRLEHRASSGSLLRSADAAVPRAQAIAAARRERPAAEPLATMRSAAELGLPRYSQPYWVQVADDFGFDVMDLVVPVPRLATRQERQSALVATYSMPMLLEALAPPNYLQLHQVWLTESDGAMIARAAFGLRGRGVYTASSTIDLPGTGFVLRANSTSDGPRVIPNLMTGMLILLTMALVASGLMLARDIRLRARAEQALREAHAFRKAMEDSLVTGLRARDLDGRITHVNPAFCEMTGWRADELIGSRPPMPYWAPEAADQYEQRRAKVLAGAVGREGYETIFMRRDGERFPVLIFEAPLIDESGRQTGWMSSVLDISEQKRIEALNRQQQEQLQGNARLAMLGEVASALSHELNQPLAAITSYATACQNLLDKPRPGAIAGALQRIREQAERAGRVIRSVHEFVRRRAVQREPVDLASLLTAVDPLIRLQAAKAGVVCQWRSPEAIVVHGDRILLEQVLLNLTRNACEAMVESEPARRVLEIETRQFADTDSGEERHWVEVAVLDRGSGIDPAALESLFTAFRSDKADGMGIGLSFCRSVIEQLGGRLTGEPRPGGGSVFRFTLRTAPAAVLVPA